MPSEPRPQNEIAADLLNDGSAELSIREQPVPVQDAAADYAAAVRDILAAGDQLTSDLEELNEKRDLIPATGWNRLKSEAVAEAKSRSGEATRRAERAMDGLKAALTDAALPAVDPAREGLARDEARIALGGAEDAKLVSRAMNIVQYGSPEASGVIFSPFFRTMLAARGVKNPDEALATLKTIAASVAPQRGTTQKEILAGAGLKRLGKLEGSRAAAQLHVSRVAG